MWHTFFGYASFIFFAWPTFLMVILERIMVVASVL